MAPNDSWLTRTKNAAVAGVGNFTGGIVNAAGNGVAGAGRGAGNSITNTSRGWGDQVRNYGNYIKDTTGASGTRSSTAANPLGISSTKQGARAAGPNTQRGGYRYSGKGSASNPLGL